MISFLQIVFLLLVGVIVLACKSTTYAGTLLFLPMLGLVALPLLKTWRVSLLAAFAFAFVYMILPEAVLNESELVVKWGESHVLLGWRVLVFSYIALYLGYLAFEKKNLPNEELRPSVAITSGGLQRAKIGFAILTVFLLVLYAPMIVYGLTVGRGSSSLHNPEDGGGLLFNVGVLGYFLSSLCYAVCSFWGYYFAKQGSGAAPLIKAIAFSSPILLIGVASGTRYFLCFMLACLLLPWIYELSVKKFKWFAIGGLCIVVIFSAMKASRYGGFELSAGFSGEESSAGTLTEKIASKGSTEGLIRNMAMIDVWTTTHDFTYGKSIGFLGIFWIPRAIWEGKPTQVDHWLIREYESGFGGGYSTASSFCGELFMDFGYFCILICFALGAAMSRLDVFIQKNLMTGGFVRTALAGILVGWAFFMTRSFMTASYPLVLALPVLWTLNKMIVKEKISQNSRKIYPGGGILSWLSQILKCLGQAFNCPIKSCGNGGAA